MEAAAPDGHGGLSQTTRQFLPFRANAPAPASVPSSLVRSAAGGSTAARVPELQLPQTPAPSNAAPAQQQRHDEAPWTQDTARALRRAQQEVAELFAAHGQQPAERALLFDLTGMRAHGCNSNSRPMTTSCSGGGSHSNSSAGGPRTSSTGGAAVGAAGGYRAAGIATAHNRQASDAGTPGQTRCNSNSGCASPATPASPADAPLLFKRQYRFDSILAEQEREAAAQQQQQKHQPKAQQRRRLQPQPQQQRQQPLPGPGASNRPVTGSCGSRMVRTSRARPSHPAALDVAPLAQAMTRRREATNNSHLQVNSCSRLLQASHQHGIPGDRAHSARPGTAAAAHNANAQIELPAGWWSTGERALSDPLLLCMPVWLRQALELELMP